MSLAKLPRVSESERDGVPGLRIRHANLSMWLSAEDGWHVANAIADILERQQS